jgi:hypothetical protein
MCRKDTSDSQAVPRLGILRSDGVLARRRGQILASQGILLTVIVTGSIPSCQGILLPRMCVTCTCVVASEPFVRVPIRQSSS